MLQPGPAISSAARHRPLCASLAAILVPAALTVAVAGWFSGDPSLRALAGLISAALALGAGGALSTWLVVAARARLAEAEAAAHIGAGSQLFAASAGDPLAVERRGVVQAAGWPQTMVMVPASAAAAAALWLLPPSAGLAAAAGSSLLVWGLVALGAAFPLLVAERLAATAGGLPEQAALARLLRLGVWTLIGAGAIAVASAGGWAVVAWAQWPLATLILLIAGELLLRAVVRPLTAGTDAATAVALGDSALAGLVLARGDPVSGMQAGLKERFGVDLARSWALQFLRRTAPPVAAATLLLAWLLSGVSIIALGERGVYERCGVPSAVFHAGPHLHLPWPFGIVHRVEHGRIHVTALGQDPALGQAPTALAPLVAVEGDPGAAHDRLWEVAHAAESDHLVPAAARGAPAAGQGESALGFQLVSCDVRVRWMVGESDRDALASAYRFADPAAAIQAAARRQLTAAFAGMTLDRLVAADREALAGRVAAGIRTDLERGGASGLTILAVQVDAIHPPVAAAAAWHGVRVADIGAQGALAVEQAVAARTLAVAATDAHATSAAATAAAAETRANAIGGSLRFTAEQAAWERHGAALAIERRLAALTAAWQKTDPIIIDHRLPGAAATLDLRPPGTPRE